MVIEPDILCIHSFGVRASLDSHFVTSDGVTRSLALDQSLYRGHFATSLLWDLAPYHAVFNVTPRTIQIWIYPPQTSYITVLVGMFIDCIHFLPF